MIPGYLHRFVDLYERQGRCLGFLDNKLWVKYGKTIVPVGPPHLDYSISEPQAYQLLKKSPGSLLVRYSYVPKVPSSCEWYAVICDTFKDLESYRGKFSKDIKKGLENCEVRQVDAAFIVQYGYDVYLSAFARYQGVLKPMSREEFSNMIKATIDFEDIYHYWGAIYKNKLVAYMVLVLYGDEAADLSVGKFIPEFFEYRPSDALIYTITQHYLQNKTVSYVSAGYRNIHHITSVQQYLLRKFPFRKKYLTMGVTYNNILLYLLKATFPFRGLLSKMHHDLGSIYKLEEIRRKCKLDALGCD